MKQIKSARDVDRDEQRLILESAAISRQWGDLGEDVDGWRFQNAAAYAKRAIEALGDPDEMSENRVIWNDVAGFKRIEIRDENIRHQYPKPHPTYVYGTIDRDIPDELTDELAEIDAAIMIDEPQSQITVRAASIAGVAVVVGFVDDVVSGEVMENDLRREYAKRLTNRTVPEWFDDPLKEIAKTPKD